MDFTQRRILPHAVPSWVEAGALFFVTICAKERGTNSLCVEGAGDGLLAAARAYHERQIWYARLVVLMPDHLHALLAVPKERTLKTVVTQWKSYTAKTLGVNWQRDFFDHRLRGDESPDAKAAYVRENPVRAGLAGSAQDWRWQWEAGCGENGPGRQGSDVA